MPIHSYHYFQEARAAQAENSHGKLETKIEIGKTVLLLSCSTIILIATVLATKKKLFYLRFQTHQQCLLSLRLCCLSEQKKNLKDFFLGKDIYMVCVSSNQLYQSTSPLIFHAVPTNTSAMLLTFVGFVFDATGNIR